MDDNLPVPIRQQSATPLNLENKKRSKKKAILIIFLLIILILLGYSIFGDISSALSKDDPLDYPNRKVLVFGDYPTTQLEKKPFKLTLTQLNSNISPIKTLTFKKPLKMLTNFYYDRALFGDKDRTEYWLIDINGNKKPVNPQAASILGATIGEGSPDSIYFINPETLIYSECKSDCHLVKINIDSGKSTTLASMVNTNYRLAGIAKTKTVVYLLGSKNSGRVFIKYDLVKNKVVKEKSLPVNSDSLWLSPNVENIGFITYNDKYKPVVNLYNLTTKQTERFTYDVDPLPYKIAYNNKLLWSPDSFKVTFIAEALRQNLRDCCQKLKMTVLKLDTGKFIDIQDLGISVEKNLNDLRSAHNWMDGLSWIDQNSIQVAQYMTLDVSQINLGFASRNVLYDLSKNSKQDMPIDLGKVMSDW